MKEVNTQHELINNQQGRVGRKEVKGKIEEEKRGEERKRLIERKKKDTENKVKGFSRVVVFYGESSKELRALSLLFAVHRIFLVFARLNPLHLVPLAACPDGGGEKRKWRDAVMTQSWRIGRNPGPEMALTTEATTQRKTREKETKRSFDFFFLLRLGR